MVARGYTTPDQVAAYLGVALTAAQVHVVDQLLMEAVEVDIDAYTGYAYVTTAITNQDYYHLPGPHLFLRSIPVVSVQSVTARTDLSAAETTLTAGVDYELRDLARGWLYLPAQGGDVAGGSLTASSGPYGTGRPYDRVRVSYTPAATIPANVRLAATIECAHRLQPHLSGLPASGIKSYSIGGELSVTFADAGAAGGGGLCSEARARLSRKAIFA